jgi:methylated-DNA-protein-cysteine methyltransferase-like protein
VKPPKRSVSLRSVRGERVHGEVAGDRAGAYDQVFAMTRRIPRGRVMTYGQIATLIENRLSARAVGWAMHGCPANVPWQRVVNASGGCSTDRIPDIPEGLQRAMLEQEAVEFRENGTLDLERYRWIPPEHRGHRGPPGRRNKKSPSRR